MKLRDSIADEGESPAQCITRLENYLNKWIELTKIPKTFAGMVQLILTEQCISTCSNDLATFLKERTCESLKDLGKTANKYLEAHGNQMKDVSKKTNMSKIQNSSSGKLTCSYCHRMGHTVKEYRAKKQAESPDAQQQGSSRVECWVCNRKGHKSRDCKKLESYTTPTDLDTFTFTLFAADASCLNSTGDIAFTSTTADGGGDTTTTIAGTGLDTCM